MSKFAPLTIAILSDRRLIGELPFFGVGEKYVSAIADYLGARVLMLPATSAATDLLELADGLLLPGSHSNMDPARYGEKNRYAQDLLDPARDDASQSVIVQAIELDKPIFGICRGFQEINVRLGGALHQRLAELPNMLEHRESDEASMADKYSVSHSVTLNPNGLLANAYGKEEIAVNSLHMQGIATLADSLRVEATAPDELVEAFSLDRDDRFVLGVQWHPEWRVSENPSHQVLFDLFAQACEQRR